MEFPRFSGHILAECLRSSNQARSDTSPRVEPDLRIESIAEQCPEVQHSVAPLRTSAPRNGLLENTVLAGGELQLLG